MTTVCLCGLFNKLQVMPNAPFYAHSIIRDNLESSSLWGKVSLSQTKTTSYSCTNVMQASIQQVHWLHKLKTKHLFLPLFFSSKPADLNSDSSGATSDCFQALTWKRYEPFYFDLMTNAIFQPCLFFFFFYKVTWNVSQKFAVTKGRLSTMKKESREFAHLPWPAAFKLKTKRDERL